MRSLAVVGAEVGQRAFVGLVAANEVEQGFAAGADLRRSTQADCLCPYLAELRQGAERRQGEVVLLRAGQIGPQEILELIGRSRNAPATRIVGIDGACRVRAARNLGVE